MIKIENKTKQIMVEKTNETKSWFFRKMNIIDIFILSQNDRENKRGHTLLKLEMKEGTQLLTLYKLK